MSISGESALFMTIPRAAKKLGVGVRRLAKAIAAGQVAAVKIGEQRMVSVAAIEKLARRGENDDR